MATIAKFDCIVKDALGVRRKIFAGTVVPDFLVEAYKAAGKPKKAKAEKQPEVNKAHLTPVVDKGEDTQSATGGKSSRRPNRTKKAD